MAKFKRNYNMNVPDQRLGESDFSYYKRLAKIADQRMVRLEKLASDPTFENVTKYAYANAQYDIKALAHKTDATRFNQIPMRTKSGALDMRNVNARINAVKRFLESPTSTKTGIVKSYKNRADTINERYGTDFTWQEMQSFFERRKTELADSQYGSKTELRAYGAIQRHGNNIADIKAKIERGETVRLANDEVVNEVAIQLLTNGSI